MIGFAQVRHPGGILEEKLRVRECWYECTSVTEDAPGIEYDRLAWWEHRELHKLGVFAADSVDSDNTAEHHPAA